jgi:hypothetical protein
MKPTDKFTISSKVAGTMKVKTNRGRTIPFVLLNAPLIASLKLSLNALGLLARIESITRSNKDSNKRTTKSSTEGSNSIAIDALYLSRHTTEPMETLMEALLELYSKNLLKRENTEMNFDKKNAAKTDKNLSSKTNSNRILSYDI